MEAMTKLVVIFALTLTQFNCSANCVINDANSVNSSIKTLKLR